jgi:hypothetical protein
MKSYKVFISHSSKDKSFVDKLVNDLVSIGISVWYDKFDLILGDSIPGKINEGLADSKYFFIVLSSNSISSKWVIEELNAALIKQINMNGTFIIPILIENCNIPPLLSHRVFADFRTNYKNGKDEVISFLVKDKFASNTVDKVLYPWPDFKLTDKQFIYLHSERFDKFFRMSCDLTWTVLDAIEYIINTLNLPLSKELPEFGMLWSFSYEIIYQDISLGFSQTLSESLIENGSIIKLKIIGTYEDLIEQKSQNIWSGGVILKVTLDTDYIEDDDFDDTDYDQIQENRGKLTKERLKEIEDICFAHV